MTPETAEKIVVLWAAHMIKEGLAHDTQAFATALCELYRDLTRAEPGMVMHKR